MQLLLKVNKIITYQISQPSMDNSFKTFTLFCADHSPVQPANYIFDKTYKNMSEKKRFEKDPKFAYFNALTKLKNNYKQTNKDIYSFIFKPQPVAVQQNNQHEKYESRQTFLRNFVPRRTFHVEKINNHAFKIYKDKRKEKYSNHNLSQNIESIKDIDFKVHFKSLSRQQEEKPKFELLLTEYKKLQEIKSKTNPERINESRITRSSVKVKRNLSQKTESVVPQRKNFSVNSASRFITTAKSKSRSNMSELAFKISN